MRTGRSFFYGYSYLAKDKRAEPNHVQMITRMSTAACRNYWVVLLKLVLGPCSKRKIEHIIMTGDNTKLGKPPKNKPGYH